ncbi:PLD nuclease N-terminal domain-containing protein [Vallicoccus soli]|uniref:PLDc_N domain-containing protein n=1 Tax=Vallicoccus soli TaxID=2339232 RepID=A0A3A3ZK62_9ACTN|nr:PLD nuclease N-terminal domain-containing protein [Vallicoccus soli]RJK96099.1 PLDc_N domain-containing protein [Vallicoccus soli]
MPRLLAAGLGLALVVYALIDCAQAPRREVRSLPKPAWFAVILLVPLVGAVAWLLAGRPRSGPAPEPARPVAPDDDPEFLGRLRTLDEEHEELVRRWEREERRRAARGGGATPPPVPGPAERGEQEPPGPAAPRDARAEGRGPRDPHEPDAAPRPSDGTPVDDPREPGA